MPSITEYRDLIKSIPAHNQSSMIKRKVWDRFPYDEKEIIGQAIFGDKSEIELSREEVFTESDIAKKIVKVLMWGYPTGGRGRNIANILTKIGEVSKLLSQYDEKDITKDQAVELIKKLEDIRGLGISTWSKLLYFFNIAIDSRKCQIYDLKIVDSLNKKQFSELGTQVWKQDNNHYFQYIELVDDLAERMCVSPEQVELFLFYFNLYYKF